MFPERSVTYVLGTDNSRGALIWASVSFIGVRSSISDQNSFNCH